MNHASARLLVVDDDRLLRRILHRLLVGDGFTHVDEAENGLDALVQLCAVPYDLVISDWEMPALDGRGLLRAVRDWPERRHTRVLILSGSPPDLQAMEKASGLLTKPFEPRTLLGAVERLLTAPADWTAPRGQPPERTPPCK